MSSAMPLPDPEELEYLSEQEQDLETVIKAAAAACSKLEKLGEAIPRNAKHWWSEYKKQQALSKFEDVVEARRNYKRKIDNFRAWRVGKNAERVLKEAGELNEHD